MDLAAFKADYDWREALGYGGKDTDTCAGEWLCPTPVGENPPSDEPFGMDDVVEIIAADPGVNDEVNWVCALRLADGRYAFIDAWCDYTGWDCRAGGSAWVASDIPNLIRWALTDPARARLGLPLDWQPPPPPPPPRSFFQRLKEN